MLRDEGPAVPLAGCTDLYVSLNFGTLKDKRFLNLWRLDALRKMEVRADRQLQNRDRKSTRLNSSH